MLGKIHANFCRSAPPLVSTVALDVGDVAGKEARESPDLRFADNKPKQ